MSGQPGTCNDERLRVVLLGDEESAEFASVASHVESCRACQERLTLLAADRHTWSSVCDLLGSHPDSAELAQRARGEKGQGPQSPGATRGPDHGEPARPDLAFLAPPSHPEMLGRLGRYEIERVIGAGGMGIVLKAFDTELNRPVAIKVLAAHLAHNAAARRRFAREARAAAAVVHEHVVAIHNVETDGATPFLVMQYVAGESLEARVARHGPLDAKEILRIGIQAASGLAAAHEQGVIHRDVKPGNILLEEDVDRALLVDFGLARTVDDASLTHTGVVAGTPHYMSPEQANGETTDHRTDLFSLGAVLYFMATGRPPFRAERAMGVLKRICHDRHRPVWEVNPDVPDSLARLIDRLLEKKPNRRFATAEELRQALAHALARLQQRRARSSNRVLRFVARNRGRLAAGAGLVAAAAVVAALLWNPWSIPTGDGNHDNAPSGEADELVAAPLVDEPVVGEPSFVAPAIPSDDPGYSDAVDELTVQLEQLESSLNHSVYEATVGDGWDDAVEDLNRRLDRLQSEQILPDAIP